VIILIEYPFLIVVSMLLQSASFLNRSLVVTSFSSVSICTVKSAACLSSSSSDTGKGQSKLSSNKVTHGFHLVEGRSGHDMEDYHVAEYRYENDHELGLFAIYDGHLGDSVASYLKVHLFDNILKEVSFTLALYFLCKHDMYSIYK
jgi:hypothetical protein